MFESSVFGQKPLLHQGTPTLAPMTPAHKED